MNNKFFDHKLTALSMGLLALFLSACSGGSGGVSVEHSNTINKKPEIVNSPKYEEVYRRTVPNTDEGNAYVDSNGNEITNLKNDLQKDSSLGYARVISFASGNAGETGQLKVQTFNGDLDSLNIGGTTLNLKIMLKNENNHEITFPEYDRKTDENPICCKANDSKDVTFEFLRFGEYWVRGNGNYKEGEGPTEPIGERGNFIQGYLTPKDNMEGLKGKVYFAGKWYGYAKGKASSHNRFADARYVANFDDKKLQGFLYSELSPSSANVVKDIADASNKGENFNGIQFNATIDGNSFSDEHATAHFFTGDTEGLSGTKDSYIQGTAKVEGKFFGSKDHPAQELGGVIKSDGSGFIASGVFAGKRTIQQK